MKNRRKVLGWTLRIASYFWGGTLLIWYGWRIFFFYMLFDALFAIGRDLCKD